MPHEATEPDDSVEAVVTPAMTVSVPEDLVTSLAEQLGRPEDEIREAMVAHFVEQAGGPFFGKRAGPRICDFDGADMEEAGELVAGDQHRIQLVCTINDSHRKSLLVD